MALVRLYAFIDHIQHSIDDNCVVPLNNPVALRYESASVGTATKAMVLIIMNDASQLTDGQTLTVAGVVFSFKTNPRADQIPAFPASNGQIFRALEYQINSHPVLKDRYIAFYDGVTLSISARKIGSAYDFTAVQSANGFGLSYSPGTDANFAQTKEEYAVEVEIWVDRKESNYDQFLNPTAPTFDQSEFENVIALKKQYGGQNLFEFDLSEVLIAQTKSVPPYVSPLPDGEGQNPLSAKEMIVRFAVRVFESWRENGIIRREIVETFGFNTDIETVKKTLWGIRSSERLEYDPETTYASFYKRWRIKTWDGDSIELQRIYFLTHQPAQKVIRRDSFEYLYFAFDRPSYGEDVLKMLITIEYEDCETEEFIIHSSLFNVSQFWGGVFYVETSPRIMDIPNLEFIAGKLIKQYTIQLAIGYGSLPTIGTIFTQPQTYILLNEERYDDLRPTLLFLNPLGGFDSFTPRGDILRSLKTDFLPYERTLQHRERSLPADRSFNDYSLVSTASSYQSESIVRYRYGSGILNKTHFDWLRDLTISNEVYLIDPLLERETRHYGGFQPRRVVVASSNYERNRFNDECSFNLEVEFTVNRNTLPA